MGQYECDDGNLINGDGCSSVCKLEEGFNCQKLSNSRTSCTKRPNPYGTLSLQNDNLLVVRFDEPMQIKVASRTLVSTMKLSMNIKCQLTWNLDNSFETNTVLTEFTISIFPECKIRGKRVMYTLEFDNTSLLVTLKGYELSTSILRTTSRRIEYIPGNLGEASEVIGRIFEAFSIITFLIMIVSVLFQSVAIESFWSFINMLQVLSYLPLLDFEIPYNLEVFLTEYLSMAELVIPFDLLPDFPFDPAYLAELFISNPLTEKFDFHGFNSFNFLYVYYEELFTWVIMGLVYVLLTFELYFQTLS